jgi:hypothetical protein
MKRRSRSRQPAKSLSFSGSGEASDRKGEDEGRQQQQRSGGSASSVDEISATRSVSAVEEATGRPPKKERRRCRYSGDVQVVSTGIAQDEEDEVSGKNTRGDLGNMVAQDEDGENIGAASMEQAIVDMDDDTIKDKIFFYMHKDMPEWGPDDSVRLPPYEPQ